MGTARSSVHALLQNKWYSLTELTDFTNGLARIPVATGRDQVVSLAATASSEEEARSKPHPNSLDTILTNPMMVIKEDGDGQQTWETDATQQ
jgi:hypothetical protein